MRFACCLTSQGDTKNIICRKQLLFSSFSALTSRHVAPSRGICHRTKAALSAPECRGRCPDCRGCGGQACSGHHAADSSDLFLISPWLVSIAHAAAGGPRRQQNDDLGAVKAEKLLFDCHSAQLLLFAAPLLCLWKTHVLHPSIKPPH